MKSALLILTALIMISCKSLDRICKENKQKVEFPRVAFIGVNIIPISNDTVMLYQTLLVENGKIYDFGDANTMLIPNDYHRIECRGKYLMPGLIDMHVHISDDGDMLKFLKYGVTTVRNMSDVPWWSKLMGFSDILSLKHKQEHEKVFGPCIYTFGYCLDGKPPVSPMNKKISNSISAKKEVNKEKSAGYDFIKIYDKLSEEAYVSIINSAREANIPVAGHVPDSVGLEQVLNDQIKSIEHLTGYIDNNSADYIIPKNRLDFFINKTKSNGVYNCPTIVVWENIPSEHGFDSLKNDNEFKYLKWYIKWLWKTSLSYYYKITYPDKANYTKRMSLIAQELTYELYLKGCPLLIGTDANVIGTYVGASTLKEMEIFNKCGIPIFETLRSATVVAATALGKENEIGTIEKGKQANFILLNGNPLDNIHNIRTLSYVYLNKFLFSKNCIDGLVEEYY